MRVRLLTGFAAVALLAGACGSSDDSTSAPATTAATTTSAAPATTAAAAGQTKPGGPAEVALATTPLGRILVDGEGNTLYMFGKDTKNAPSTCEDQCAEFWPPLVSALGAPTAGEGLDATLLSTIERSDGLAQVAYAGFPLYTYAEDAEPGDTKGQGVGGVWFVLDATGTPSNA